MRLLAAYARNPAHPLRCLRCGYGGFGAPRMRLLGATPTRTGLFTSARGAKRDKRQRVRDGAGSSVPATIIFGGLFIWWLYPTEELQELSDARQERLRLRRERKEKLAPQSNDDGSATEASASAWNIFSSSFSAFSDSADSEWISLSDKIVDFILPDWSQLIPGYVRKLQDELSMGPGSLADEIWRDAHDPYLNPEIQYSASVRVSSDLCDEEKEFLARRKKATRAGLARYLGVEEKEVHPDDVPVIAMCGSGGGLRALVAGTGSMLAADEDGLLDCVTYTSGVSGSCWLQALYFSSVGGRSVHLVLEHLKARAAVHIAYPPVAFQALVSAPTNKYLLSGFVEKLRGDPKATFGLVDIYGLLLAARFLVPKGELGVNDRDLKLSNQRDYVKYGQNPLPIYTAVRHEIPGLHDDDSPMSPEVAKEVAKREAWFQWYEITPYEFFCEEFAAGIPTWAMGRKFEGGVDVPGEDGHIAPEVRLPFLMGVFGSAFCATLSHYYKEIRPLVHSITGFGALDEIISGRYNEDLSKVHPIDPGTVANFVHGMHGELPETAPEGIYDKEYIQLMDAGMSNNLPIYPLLRPGRGVDIVVTFDASADVKTDNWLAEVDGYARQRGIKGWPVGIGWPKPGETSERVTRGLEEVEASAAAEGKSSIAAATPTAEQQSSADPADLGYCTVWVGTSRERASSPPPASKALTDTTNWQLMDPDAGIAVVYMPLLANPARVPGVDPLTSDYLSTWNFVYTPEQIEQVTALAMANYDEGRRQIRETVMAVYLRRKKAREQREEAAKRERYRGLMRRGLATKLGEGDQFS